MISIEKNIPIPKLERGTGLKPRAAKYPWDQLEVGNSFLVPDVTVKKFGSTVYAASKRTGRKFTLRSVEGGVRVWRTA